MFIFAFFSINGSQGSDRRGQGNSTLIYRKSSSWLEYIKFRSAVFTHEISIVVHTMRVHRYIQYVIVIFQWLFLVLSNSIIVTI